jgi:hypothetical protein
MFERKAQPRCRILVTSRLLALLGGVLKHAIVYSSKILDLAASPNAAQDLPAAIGLVQLLCQIRLADHFSLDIPEVKALLGNLSGHGPHLVRLVCFQSRRSLNLLLVNIGLIRRGAIVRSSPTLIRCDETPVEFCIFKTPTISTNLIASPALYFDRGEAKANNPTRLAKDCAL